MSQNLKTWETTMASDFNDILVVLGKTKPAPSNIFQEAKYNGAFFRYLSLAEKNLGLCWTIRRDYLILTTSGESLLETMKLLEFTPIVSSPPSRSGILRSRIRLYSSLALQPRPSAKEDKLNSF